MYKQDDSPILDATPADTKEAFGMVLKLLTETEPSDVIGFAVVALKEHPDAPEGSVAGIMSAAIPLVGSEAILLLDRLVNIVDSMRQSIAKMAAEELMSSMLSGTPLPEDGFVNSLADRDASQGDLEMKSLIQDFDAAKPDHDSLN